MFIIALISITSYLNGSYAKMFAYPCYLQIYHESCRSVFTEVQGWFLLLYMAEALVAFCRKNYWGQHFSWRGGGGVVFIRQFHFVVGNFKMSHLN